MDVNNIVNTRLSSSSSLPSVLNMSMTIGRGEITLILGPMFSGKTSELIRLVRRYTCAKRRCVVIKYFKDDRYSDDCAASHNQDKIPAISTEHLTDVEAAIESYDVIGIDEGQFFFDLPRCAEKWANAGKIVIVAALDGDFQRKPFKNATELIPFCEHVTKLNAICHSCCGDAAFTKRTTTEKVVEVIGGADKYVAACRQCHGKMHLLPEVEKYRSQIYD